jgi:hypothetical protein
MFLRGDSVIYVLKNPKWFRLNNPFVFLLVSIKNDWSLIH